MKTKQFQCVYHPEFETNSIADFKTHLHSHQKITQSQNIDERIPEVLTKTNLLGTMAITFLFSGGLAIQELIQKGILVT